MDLNNVLDFLIVGSVNALVLVLVALFLTKADYEEDKNYYKNLQYKKRGEKWK